MDFSEFISTVLVPSGLSSAIAIGLGKIFISHRLTIELEKSKVKLQNEMATHKVEAEGEIRKQVEKILADQAADRSYIQEARRRLYTAVGPLRFQLLLACRDLSNRVKGHGRKNYKFDMDNYYARSFLYRVIRPLTLFELIERQMSQTDFSVDPIGKRLLEFHSSASNIFCGSDLPGEHAAKNMEFQTEHIFHSNISMLASALIVSDKDKERCMRYDEFVEFSFLQVNGEKLEPLRTIFINFSARTKPIFWLRLVAYCNLCDQLINTIGADIGFQKRTTDIQERLTLSFDTEILNNMSVYVARCEKAATAQL